VRGAARLALAPLALLAFALAGPARAALEWYDYYLQARDKDIPARRFEDCVKNLQEALRLRPASGNNVQLYGLQFEHYLPHYYIGICRLEQQDFVGAAEAFNREERAGAIQKTPLLTDLVKRRGEAQAAQAALLTQRARGEVRRLLERAQELGRRGAWDDSLPELAKAEALAKSLDAETLRSVTQEQERQRAAQSAALEAAARAQRLEQRLAEGDRLLEEGRANEAKLAFDQALDLAPRHPRALEGKRAAEDKILASTTRAMRQQKLADGKALFESGRLEEALVPLSDAAADPTLSEARDLMTRARQMLETLRRQKELRAEIDRRAARAEELLAGGRFPEAVVAFQAVLELDAGHPHASERLAEAERRTGEALVARWLPNQEPSLALFDAAGGVGVVDTPTLSLQGAASDDHGVQKIEFRIGERLVSELVPESTPLQPARMVPFVRELALEPGPNQVVVTAIDSGGLSHSVPFRVERRLRFHETPYFIPSAVASAFGLVGLGWTTSRVRRWRARRRRFNPYIAGAPVLDDEMFYGREKLTARMLSTLHRNSLMITGERRIGKTTFLYHLMRVLATDDGGEWRFFPVFVDLQGVPEQAFFHALMAETVDSLELSPATRAELRFTHEADGYDARDFGHDLQRVIAELKTRTPRKVKLALLIDEVDVLNEYSESVNQRLRGIFMKSLSENLVAVMSGVGIRRRWKSEVSPWYNFFDEVELTPFSREEAEALVREPVKGVFRWRPEAVERVLELSQLRPYLVQKLCVHALNRMLEQGRGSVRREDVDAARDAVQVEDQEGAAEPGVVERPAMAD
jgi:tetratricopeptide (TPR) repeat protein